MLVACLLPAGARAGFTAVVEDPAGDAATPEPGHDLLSAGVGYDRRSGQIVGAVKLRGAPGDGRAFLHLQVGRMAAGSCEGPPVLALGSYTDEYGASWLRFAGPGQVTARGDADKRGGGGTVQTLEATARPLRGARPDCALALLSEPSNPANVYDSVGPFRLAPQPALAAKAGGLPEDVRSGRTYRLKVTVSNPGDAKTRPITVRLRRAKGVAGSGKAVRLKALRPGRRATATFAIRPGRGARFATELLATASAGRLKAEATRKIYVSSPKAPSRRGGSGGGGSRLCTRWIPDFTGESGGSLGLVPC